MQELAGRHVFIQTLGEDNNYVTMHYFNNSSKRNGIHRMLIAIIALQKKAADYYSLENNAVQAICPCCLKVGEEFIYRSKVGRHGCFNSEIRPIRLAS